MPNKKRSITKKEAATKQLDTVIKLFFENRDLISAYSLCAAADGILEGIYKNKRLAILAKQRSESDKSSEIRFSWREEWEIRLKPERVNEGFRLLVAAQNFFKHADKDPNSALEFGDCDETSVRLFVAVTNYRLVFCKPSRAMSIFFTFYAMLHPKILRKDNPLFEHIVGNPLCEKLAQRFSQAEIAAIGYKNLKNSCPELFPPTDIQSNLQPHYVSRGTIRVPSSKG